MKFLYVKDLWFINDELWKLCICDAYNAVNICDLYDFIKSNEIQSFMMFSYDDTTLHNKFKRLSHQADIRGLHSGASYGCTMRIVENIIKSSFLHWKYDYIKIHHKYIVDKVFLIQKNFKIAISNPDYKMCRSRLKREFSEFIV